MLAVILISHDAVLLAHLVGEAFGAPGVGVHELHGIGAVETDCVWRDVFESDVATFELAAKSFEELLCIVAAEAKLTFFVGRHDAVANQDATAGLEHFKRRAQHVADGFEMEARAIGCLDIAVNFVKYAAEHDAIERFLVEVFGKFERIAYAPIWRIRLATAGLSASLRAPIRPFARGYLASLNTPRDAFAHFY